MSSSWNYKCQLRTEKCQLKYEKCQLGTEKYQGESGKCKVRSK